MGKASKRKKKPFEVIGTKQPGLEERVVSSSLFGRYELAIALLLITLTALLIYSNTFSSSFHFDDESSIVQNYQLRDLTNFWPSSGIRSIGFLSFAFNYYFGQLDVFGYHLVNITIHIINGLLVWWLVLLTFKTPIMAKSGGLAQLKYFISLVSALIFIAHPVQTQAVTYIVQRFASLATLFYLLSLGLYIKARLLHQTAGNRSENIDQSNRNIKIKSALCYVISIASAVFAMKTKEISFTLPIMIALYELIFLSTPDSEHRTTNLQRLYLLIPFLLTLLIIPMSLIRADQPLGNIIGELRQASQETEEIPRNIYLLTQFRVIMTYIKLLFLPINQNLDYDYPLSDSLFEPETFICFLFLLSIFTSAIYLLKKSWKTHTGYGLLVAFGILWFFITLSVESSIIPIKDVIFEHRLYLPSIGVMIAFSSIVFYVFDHTKPKLSSLFVTCILLLITAVPLGIAAYNRNFIWKDDVNLWEDVVRKSPNKARGHNNLGLAYADQKLLDKAVQEYMVTLKLKSDYPEARTNLGNAYADQGRLDEAIQEYITALKLKSDYPEARTNLGNVYANQGRLNEAIQEYMTALKLKSDIPQAHYNLGNAYANQGRLDEAIQEYMTALKLKSDYSQARTNLGLAYADQGRLDEAIQEYMAALKLKSDYPEAHNNLGNAYANQGRLDEAVREYMTALKLKSDYPEAHNNLGFVYSKQGRLDEAIQEYMATLVLKPDYAEANYSLGNIYKTKGLKAEAKRQFEKALKLKPDFAAAQQALKSLGTGP